MKTIRWILVCALVCSAGVRICRAQEPADRAQRSAEGRLRAAAAESAQHPAADDPAVKGPLLVFDETTHDFGDVERRGGDLVREFVFRNEGSAPLVLLRVLTSCSCLKASFSKRPVAPGGEETVRITYEPHKSEPGVFNKVIQVYSNSVSGREILTVQGNSVDGAGADRRGRE